MNWLNRDQQRRFATSAHWGWLLPILALAPFSLAAKGCSNSGVVGDDCPTTAECSSGTAGSNGTAGSGGSGKTCGGIIGSQCGSGEFCAFSTGQCGNGDQTGTCRTVPDVCDASFKPVCGCDDKTYSNACSANAKGVSVAKEGACAGDDPNDKVCGGLTAQPCAAGEYCNFPATAACGNGDQTGTCESKPEACTEEYAPVCGCDGKTYGNACSAAAAGASVAKSGECGTNPGGACGGRNQGMCAPDEYCQYAPGADCGRFDASGQCVPWPKNGACDAVYDPVCGCDGKTYGNDCEAAVAGISVDYAGECMKNPTGGQCGGILGSACPGGQYCNYPLDMACGNADGTGTCTAIPGACPANVDPVCGCDGKTYGNACEAGVKGVSVAAKGACK